MKYSKQEKQEALDYLRSVLAPGDTVFTVLRHVSRSGMMRRIDVYKLVDGDRLYLSGYAAVLLEERRPDDGIRTTGCGMDMGFNMVYNLSWLVFHDDPRLPEWAERTKKSWQNAPTDAGYALNQRWL